VNATINVYAIKTIISFTFYRVLLTIVRHDFTARLTQYLSEPFIANHVRPRQVGQGAADLRFE